jgi:hypothetical protein
MTATRRVPIPLLPRRAATALVTAASADEALAAVDAAAVATSSRRCSCVVLVQGFLIFWKQPALYSNPQFFFAMEAIRPREANTSAAA